MKILADENTPLLQHFFDSLGKLETFNGRELSRKQLKHADVLLVRSITKVDESLLKGSQVKFVGSATIGIDHIDIAYLEQSNIQYASAPGVSASSVVEYVVSCLCFLSEFDQFRIQDKTVAIVGYGNIGSGLAKCISALGANVVINDPPLKASMKKENDIEFVSLKEALEADIISLHVPLTEQGEHPTRHLIDSKALNHLKAGQVLINTSRGAVIDNAALLKRLQREPDLRVVLDVWENEPNINLNLLDKVLIGTPHIAGYSLDGKARGTEAIYRALCQFLGLPVRHKAAQFLPEPPLTKLGFSSSVDVQWALTTAVRCAYDVRVDNWRMKARLAGKTRHVDEDFDAMRRDYPVRREFNTIKVNLKNVDAELYYRLKTLGFNIKS